ncbi:MAG: tandem-95 repeat protein, partial [Chloroflexi bacterium]|nr:tandem-95 repeat protein [Chloroflexota bacterium]
SVLLSCSGGHGDPPSGGGRRSADSGSAMLTGTHVTGNSASNYGGGIYVNSGSATLTGTQIAANDAPVGSALYNYKGAITSTTALTITGDIYQRDGVFAASGHDLRIEGGLQLAGGDFYATGAPTGTFTLTGPYTHTGGTYHQVKPVDGAIDVGFPKAGGVIVNANGQNLGSTEVADTAGADCAGMTPGDAVQHCYTIRPTIASGRAAAVTFYYQSGELPAGHACVAMEAYHQPGTLGVLLQRDATYGSAGRMCGPEPQSLRVVGVSDFAPFILRGPAVDVRISKSVTPTVADPGQLVTYTLDFSNVGIITATGVVITDSMPVSVSAGSIVSSGAEITQIGPGYVWAVQDLAPGDGGVITITGALPVPLSSGPLTNTVTITTTEIDADGANNSHAAGLTVNDVAPIAGDDAFTVELDSIDNPLTVLDGDSDANGDTLTITAVGTPDSDGTAVNGSTVVTYTPLAGSLGDEVFTYTISDDNGGTDTATVTVTIIEDVNNWPIALSDTFTVDEDSIDNPFDVLSNDFDPDGDTLTISAVGPLNKGGTAVNGGTIITYTPLADFYGVETFTYTIGDGNGGFDTSVVSVIVNQGPVGNNPPVAVDDAAVTAWVTPVTVTVLDNDSDPDSDTITVIAVGAAANGTTAHSTSIVTYTSDPSFTGTDTFTYTISDGEDSDTALVIVNVGQARFIIDADDPTDVTITLPGSCNIRIGAPVGAVPVDMDMLYNAAQAPVARPPNHEFVGCAFTLDAYQGGARQDDLDFDVPISVALTYEATSVVGLSLDDMHLFARNSDSDEWSTDGITRESLDPVARRHSSQVAHLTQFALFAQPEPALRVYKSVDTGGADPLPLGSMVTYTLVISNSTDEVANNVVLTDPLPSGVTFGDWVMYGGSAILPPPEIVNLPPVTVKWSPGDIAAGTAYTLSFTANVVTDTQFAGNTITNTAYVIADNAPLGSDSASFGIIGGGSYIYLPLVLKE